MDLQMALSIGSFHCCKPLESFVRSERRRKGYVTISDAVRSDRVVLTLVSVTPENLLMLLLVWMEVFALSPVHLAGCCLLGPQGPGLCRLCPRECPPRQPLDMVGVASAGRFMPKGSPQTNVSPGLALCICVLLRV